MFTVENNTILTDAVIRAAYKDRKEKNGDVVEHNTVTIIPDDEKIYDECAPAFKNVGKKYIPSWFKSKEYIKLKSLYNIPVMRNDEEITFDEWLQTGLVKGAKAKVRFVLKKEKDSDEFAGVVYPLAIKIYEDGEPLNVFEGM